MSILCRQGELSKRVILSLLLLPTTYYPPCGLRLNSIELIARQQQNISNKTLIFSFWRCKLLELWPTMLDIQSFGNGMILLLIKSTKRQLCQILSMSPSIPFIEVSKGAVSSFFYKRGFYQKVKESMHIQTNTLL